MKTIRPIITPEEEKEINDYFNMKTDEPKPFLSEEDVNAEVMELNLSMAEKMACKHGFIMALRLANPRIAYLEMEISNLNTVMIAAAEEIQAHWQAHCDEDGYGPQNLMLRLERGIPAQYNYTAGEFERQEKKIAELEKELCDTKANLGRAYNGLDDLKEAELYKRVKKLESDKLTLKNKNEQLEKQMDEQCIKYNQWYNSLRPEQKCTVHPPAGSGLSHGIYRKSDEELLAQFKSQIKGT